MAKCYQLDSDGFLIMETTAPGGFLPAGAIFSEKEPELVEGFHPCWNGKKFVQKESRKGKKGYLDGKPHIIQKHGPLPKGFSTEPPYPTDAEVDAEARAYVMGELAANDAAYLTPRVLAGLALGDKYALEQYRKHEEEAESWRIRLAAIPATTETE